jgi:hypothetical protein
MNPTAEWADKLFPAGGWFVEAGAHDGVGDSQTLELENTGRWTGLCVEPSKAFVSLQTSRKCKVDNRCLADYDGDVVFLEVSGNAVELSGMVGFFCRDGWDRENRPHSNTLKECTTLVRMLEHHEAPLRIELLCLDTEGSEFAILKRHDFDRFRFLAIQVEHNGVQSRKTELHELLTRKGYLFDGTDEINDRYLFGGQRASPTTNH